MALTLNNSVRYTIYKITNTLNNKIYIGKHQTENPNDSYYGSGKALKNAINKYGKEFFIKEILFDFNTEEEMNLMEIELIDEKFVQRPDTYNLGVGGEGGAHFKGRKHTIESINKSIQSKKDNGYLMAKSTKDKLSKKLKGRIFSEETKLKMSKSAKNRPKNNKNSLSMEQIFELWKSFRDGNYKYIRQFALQTTFSHTTISNLFRKHIHEYTPKLNKPFGSILYIKTELQ